MIESIELIQYIPEVIKAMPPFPFAAVAIGGALLGMNSARKGRSMANRIQKDNLANQQIANADLAAETDLYRSMSFTNPFENLDNSFQSMTNQYAGMENSMEDLEVNTQQADFEQRSLQQNQANIMSNLRGAAGGSGVAGLAQALANQGVQQTARSSASIGMQETQNQKLAAQESSRIQMLIRGEDSKMQQTIMGEDARLQGLEAQGDLAMQQAERDRQATLLGMAQGRAAGANASVQQGYSNQMAAQSATTSQMFGLASSFVPGIPTT